MLVGSMRRRFEVEGVGNYHKLVLEFNGTPCLYESTYFVRYNPPLAPISGLQMHPECYSRRLSLIG